MCIDARTLYGAVVPDGLVQDNRNGGVVPHLLSNKPAHKQRLMVEQPVYVHASMCWCDHRTDRGSDIPEIHVCITIGTCM